MAFYPGAGLDVTPIVLYPHIKNWYYMDSQPDSEFGSAGSSGRPSFIPRLGKIMHQIGFECIVHTDHSLLFQNATTNRTVTYYINATFPKALEYCYLPCTTLVLCGYSMPDRPPHFFAKWTQIICNNKTNYDEMKSDWHNATVSTIVWDENTEEFLDEHRTEAYITHYATIQ